METLARYNVIGELGQGTMTRVLRAHDPKIDRLLIIKILRKEKCVDAEYRSCFLREANAAGNLSHPNIVTIYDIGEHEGQPYIVMELLEGASLTELLQSGKAFTLEEVLTIGVQLANALDYAHSQGVVHCDIKPSNILYTATDSKIKITDFGIARLTQQDVTQYAQDGDLLGSPYYMSPEQVLGKGIDGRSDLFSLGVVLFQLLSGERPFKGNTIADLTFQVATEAPLPIQQLAPDAPASLHKVIDRLLQKRPEQRFQTGRELASALSKVLAEQRQESPSTSAKKSLPTPTKWALLMTSLVALGLLLGLVPLHHNQQQARLQQAFEYGSSISNFVAAESMTHLLSQDWVTLQLFIQEAGKNKSFQYLTVVDQKGVVRGNTRMAGLGRTYTAPAELEHIKALDGADISSGVLMDENALVYDFNVPVRFQGEEIGQVHLGIAQNSVAGMGGSSLYLVLISALVVIVVVFTIAYIAAQRFIQAIRSVQQGLDEVAAERFYYRIPVKRDDELGDLCQSFNKMAASLQKDKP